jgi:hypothetical protein
MRHDDSAVGPTDIVFFLYLWAVYATLLPHSMKLKHAYFLLAQHKICSPERHEVTIKCLLQLHVFFFEILSLVLRRLPLKCL